MRKRAIIRCMPTEYSNAPTVFYVEDLLTCPPRTNMEQAKIKIAFQLLDEAIGPVDRISGFTLARCGAACQIG